MPERRGRMHEKLEPPGAIVCFSEDFYRVVFHNSRKQNQGSRIFFHLRFWMMQYLDYLFPDIAEKKQNSPII
jgi:hypothetical protein